MQVVAIRCMVSTLLLFFPLCLYAQTPDSTLIKLQDKVYKHGAAIRSPVLYLHMDKSIYVNNEHIWFTAYLLTEEEDLARYHTLYVLLADQLNGNIVASDRFVISNGIGKGQLLLTDSMPAGEYRLMAYTNVFPDTAAFNVYQQSISLRSAFRFDLAMGVPPATDIVRDSFSFIPRITSVSAGLAAGGVFKYTLYGDHKKLLTGTKKIDPFGEVPLSVPVSAAEKRLDLVAEVNFKNDRKIFRQPLSVSPQQVVVKFYPEGGELVDGHSSKIAFEIVNTTGRAIATTGKLLENGKPVAGFQSNRDGTGTFTCTPRANQKYSVVLDEEMPHVVHTDFPRVLGSGYSLHVAKAVASDTLEISIRPPSLPSSCIVMLHNYREVFYGVVVVIRGSKGILRIPVADLPPGVATLTLFDEKSRPVAERAVLLHHDALLKASVEVDSSWYHKRGMVQLKVKVTRENKPVEAVFSMACVLANRLDTTRFADITRFNMIDRYLPKAGVLPALSYFDNRDNLEMILLTSFWTRYRWNDLRTDTSQVQYKGDYGHVLFREKPVKKPVDLLMFGGQGIIQFTTDSAGRFHLPSEMLQAPPDSRIFLSVADKKSNEYALFLKSDLDTLNQFLAKKEYNSMVVERDELSAEEKKGSKEVMQTVVIKNKNNNDFGDIYKSRNCNDYVCIYNILNCRNHPGSGNRPVNGSSYMMRDPNGIMRSVVYSGCDSDKEQTSFLKLVKATYLPKEFYVADYSKFNPAEEETHTTVYWNHQVVTDRNGEAVISFYTNDLAGRFLCVLQGLTDFGPVSGRVEFRVQ